MRRKNRHTPPGESKFLPASREEMLARGWSRVDVVLVTGDAYVDHPSFGVAVIGRWLEAHGFRTAILSQPRYDSPESFKEFGRPRLFFGVTAGNLDSIVANYSGNARVRDRDDYSPDGNPYFGTERTRQNRRRPDRASIIYTSLCKAAFEGIPVILGGLEGSLRRFVHYDYQQGKLRNSILTDAKADLLVYGMGELPILEAARRLSEGRALHFIPGTCERLTERELQERQLPAGTLTLPSWNEIGEHTEKFLDAEKAVDRLARSMENTSVLQRQQAMWVLQNPPARPLTPEELDSVHALPFQRAPHPSMGDVPAWRMIRDSVTIVRGCVGNCSFCSIARHQGPVIVSRSRESILAEIGEISRQKGFKGTISDLGGPTANLFGVFCGKDSPCRRRDCLYPRVCRHLRVDEDALLELLRHATEVEGVHHVFISSGLRMELLLQTPRLLARILERHTPGALKIAPEHSEPHVLRLMHKGDPQVLVDFLELARRLAGQLGRKAHFTPYVIASHPGCRREDMVRLAEKFEQLRLPIRQFQDFTPTPGTLSTAMYVTGLDRDSRKPICVARGDGERREQRKALGKDLATPGRGSRHESDSRKSS